MDYIVVGLVAGALVAIAGYLLFEFAGSFASDDNPTAIGQTRRFGFGLMVGGVFVWIATAIAALLDPSTLVGLLIVLLTTVGVIALAWFLTRGKDEELPVLLPRIETTDLPVKATESAYLDWPITPALMAAIDSEIEIPSDLVVGTVNPTETEVDVAEGDAVAATVDKGSSLPVAVVDEEPFVPPGGEDANQSAPTVESREGEEKEASAEDEIVPALFASSLLADVDAAAPGDSGSFESSLLQDIPPDAGEDVESATSTGNMLRSWGDRMRKSDV